MLLMW